MICGWVSELVFDEAPATKSLSACMRQGDLRGAVAVPDIDLPPRVSEVTELTTGAPDGHERRHVRVPPLASVPGSSPN